MNCWKVGCGVAETKEHDSRFKEPLVHDEGCFPLVAVLDMDVVVSPTNIKFGEVMGIFQLVYKVRDEGKRVGVMGSTVCSLR